VSELFKRIAEGLSPTYQLRGRLSGGGAARVYVAEDVQRQQRVAIKILHEDFVATVSAERFVAEIQLAARLEHRNIIPLYDSGTVEGLPYYVMPLVSGESLRDRLCRVRQLSVLAAVQVTADIGAALEYAHEQGVVHRDIKPANVILTSDRAMVLDFGIALALDVQDQFRRTIPGVVPGTPEYMSPEQAAGDLKLDGRSDIYSLACVTYEMLCGEPPFVGTAGDVIACQIAANPESVSRRTRGLPRGVCAAISRALEKRPADRYATPGDFVSALQASCGELRSMAGAAR
jgi:serine/threonine-protein kinase